MAIILALCILLSVCGCKRQEQEAYYPQAGGSTFTPDRHHIYKFSNYIVKATILEKTAEYFNNPDGTKKTEAGTIARNVWITEYKVRIEKVYKGSPAQTELSVSIYNGADIPVEEFEKDNPAYFYFDVGQQCILSLCEGEDTTSYATGRYITPLYKEHSYFLPTEAEGQYKNVADIVLDEATLAEELEQYK